MIEARHISWSVSGRQLLSDCSLTSRSGTFTTLLGPNGAGKTTLLRVLSGIILPEFGEVIYNNRSIANVPAIELSKERAYLQQQSAVFESFTVRNVLEMACISARGINRHAAYLEQEKLLDEMDLRRFADRPYNLLSGGEQQRVQFARCLLQLQLTDGISGKTLMLDEPLNNLDLKYQYELLNIAHEKVCRAGGAVIAVLHDLNTTWSFSDQVILLKRGTILASGTPADVMTEQLISETYEVPVRKMTSGNDVFFTVIPPVPQIHSINRQYQSEII